jgi:5-methylcytosine-specific restriction protein B
MKPGFDSPSFIRLQQDIGNSVLDRLLPKIKELNTAIEKDDSLGSGFCIGHSYFCPPENFTDGWLSEVVH